MIRIIAALVCGVIFGAGLTISQMTETQKVQGFLYFRPVGPEPRRRNGGGADRHLRRLLACAAADCAAAGGRAQWPTKRDIDVPLVGGAVLFGIGWGLIGFCPGPAIVDLATGAPAVILFVIAMAAGMIANNLVSWREGASLAVEPAE